MRSLLLGLILLLAACEAPAPPPAPSLALGELLGGDNVEGFQRAQGLRTFSFPEDHGPHPGFRNEWWYLTGNVHTDSGRHFGYQVTFFSTALATEVSAGPETSAWRGTSVWMAHVALTDTEAGRHQALERFSRQNPGLAGAQGQPFRVWLEDWSLRAVAGDAFPWQLTVVDEDLALNLRISPQKPPVLQGEAGLSQKSPQPGNASYYYSLTRLATEGEIRVGERAFQVSGDSWLDREWSTSALAPDQSGWDWFSLQFDDNQELMYYQLRDRKGETHPNSQGNWTDSSAKQTLIRPQDMQLEELQTWTSPAGIVYATRWRMHYGDHSWAVQAVLDDQLMDLSLPYWEGAVRVLDEAKGEQVGQGYLEMVRER
ncbi:MAG: lipocalin-like domain-containing protein [Pseudomonadales bacterium]|nr:lipocalin-like domain-containing protein [Pseudomonadales bacterium]